MGINQQLFGYIDACPTAFHTVAHTADMLEDAGYTRLSETESWKLRPGRGISSRATAHRSSPSGCRRRSFPAS